MMTSKDLDQSAADILAHAGAVHVEVIVTFESGQTIHHEAGDRPDALTEADCEAWEALGRDLQSAMKGDWTNEAR